MNITSRLLFVLQKFLLNQAQYVQYFFVFVTTTTTATKESNLKEEKKCENLIKKVEE